MEEGRMGGRLKEEYRNRSREGEEWIRDRREGKGRRDQVDRTKRKGK